MWGANAISDMKLLTDSFTLIFSTLNTIIIIFCIFTKEDVEKLKSILFNIVLISIGLTCIGAGKIIYISGYGTPHFLSDQLNAFVLLLMGIIFCMTNATVAIIKALET